MKYLLSEIAALCGGELIGEDRVVESIIFDSRMAFSGDKALFAAIKGGRDGHRYLEELSTKGVSSFLISDCSFYKSEYGSAVLVGDTLSALQMVAAHYRTTFKGEVTAIIGSNGKTIVKEWIWQMYDRGNICRSPRSYNSQLGVALSLLASDATCDDVIIETGISADGEMELLERMVKPNRVVITNLGQAHDSGFCSREGKLRQKLIMARQAHTIIYPTQDSDIVTSVKEIAHEKCRLIGFGRDSADVSLVVNDGFARLRFAQEESSVKCGYMPHIAISNAAAVAAFFYDKGYSVNDIVAKIPNLQSVAMRLELKASHGGGVVVNDSYNSDIDSLRVAIDYLCSVGQDRKRVVVLSDIYNSSLEDVDLYRQVATIVEQSSIDCFIGVGDKISLCRGSFAEGSRFFDSTEELLSAVDSSFFDGAAVLIKGSRAFGLERLSLAIEDKLHSTVMEVSLERISANLSYYRSLLKPQVKVMAMVKAFSYGMGGVQVAQCLQRQGVDYLAVAYADEGVELRRGGINMPIVVLNSDPSGYSAMIEYDLEPEIYSFYSLEMFCVELTRQGRSHYPIHIKIDTGMHRLGFYPNQIEDLASKLCSNSAVRVVSVFSHLAASEDVTEDEFTCMQVDSLVEVASLLKLGLGHEDIMVHICNSAAILRHHYAHLDMVRIGIGLYEEREGEVVARLRSVVVDVKDIEAGDSVSYNRRYVADRSRKIAVVAIGYADGLDRKLSCGGWSFIVNGVNCPILGNICMDTCMVDISDAGYVKPGDSVQVFGEGNSATQMAHRLGTINYEIFTSVSRRVKRVFVQG